MINPIWLRSFIEVVNLSTMAAAARKLKITPAAICKHILSLEQVLGVQLLIRSTRRIDLTHEGTLYYEQAKKIMLAYADAEAVLSHAKEEPSGTLRIICGPQIGNLYVLPRLKQFLAEYPKIKIQMEFTQTMVDLTKEKVDLVIGLSTGIPLDWIQRTWIHSRWVFCASPEYLKEHGEPTKPSELKQHQVITRTQRDPNNLIQFKNGEQTYFEPYLYLNDTRALRRAALHGLGVVQLHDYIVQKDLQEKRLVEILKPYVEAVKTIPIHISYPQTDHLHIKVRKFIDFLLKYRD